MKRKLQYKPLLFTTTVRNPKRMRGMLKILSNFNGELLTNELAIIIMGELIRFGLYRPMKKSVEIKEKWKDTQPGEFATSLLSDLEVENMLINNPQDHKEAGFDKGWSSRFPTVFDFPKELGFVYFWINEKIEFSQLGLNLANSIKVEIDENFVLTSDIHPEFEQQAFLHALAKSQRNNPFVRVLNENVPLILLLQVIQKLNSDSEFNGAGISMLELPLIIFWKDNNAEELYQLIKSIRLKHKYNPSWEVIVDICVNGIMDGKFKKFKAKSVMVEYPDEFIRKMRLTGLISLRGGGRYIDINQNEQKKVDYILKTYSVYPKFDDEKKYFEYMADVDDKMLSISAKKVSVEENNKQLTKWTEIYSWVQIKTELYVLKQKSLSKDDVLKFLPNPVRLEFLVALAIKTKFMHVNVIPNYPCDDEGLPTSTAGGVGDKGDIECYEESNGVLIEVTMSEGRTQTMMEVWPITRHLEKFKEKTINSMCYFIAPTIFKDSTRQIDYVKVTDGLTIKAKTIEDFIGFLETETVLCQV